jgi:hypothetical protein
LRRHGVGNLGELKPAQPAPVSKTFKAYEPGFLHMDLKYLPRRRYSGSGDIRGQIPINVKKVTDRL